MIEVSDITNIEDCENTVICGDCVEAMKKFPDNFLDSCVTDPPYGIEFMEKNWDRLIAKRDPRKDSSIGRKNDPYIGAAVEKYIAGPEMQQWHYQWARELFRVMKPGAYLLAFGATRTYHRLACAIEDAGFEIVDSVQWIYGSGFPKGQNISKAIDKKLGLNGKIISEYDSVPGMTRDKGWHDGPFSRGETGVIKESVSEDAIKWSGWNTALKPAHEPIVLAQKTREGTYVNNVLKWGVGAMNIDGCRVAVNPDVDSVDKNTNRAQRNPESVWEQKSGIKNEQNQMAGVLPSGRYPANLILSHHPECKLIREGTTVSEMKIQNRDSQRMGSYGVYGKADSDWCTMYNHDKGKPEVWACVEGCPVRILNEQSGVSDSLRATRPLIDEAKVLKRPIFGQGKERIIRRFVDKGGCARFFYCAKPSKRERNAGLNGERNAHITVKPISLMCYLVRLITPRGGVVFDPFLGSGTTAIAAEKEGCRWFGCDISKEYCEIAEKRIVALGGDEDDGYEQELLVE